MTDFLIPPSPPASPKPAASASSSQSSMISTSSRRRAYNNKRIIPTLKRHETMLFGPVRSLSQLDDEDELAQSQSSTTSVGSG
ncbi:hypothetical protein RUND412_003048 [Rhizina undulata]